MKRTSLFLLPLLFLLCVGITTLRAQQPEEELSERVTKMEKILAKLPSISGFINMRYQYNDQRGNANSFDIRRARLDFKGNITRNLDYRLQVEFAGSPKILDAYFRWKINPYINVQAGEYKIPFTIENSYGPHQLETIDNSMVISRLCNYDDVSGMAANGRDVGIGLYGGFIPRDGYNVIDYSIGLFNGNGINVRDNNNSKDFAGKLTVHPIKNLGVSLTHYNGCYGPSGSTLQRVRTGAGLLYDDGELLVRGEYLHGKYGRQKSEGWYAVMAYFVHPKVQPLLKYDYFQEDKSSTTKINNYIAGINYFPAKFVRLQLNYTYRQIKHGTDANIVAAQIFGLF